MPNEEYNNVTENRGDISMYEPTKEASGKGIKSRRSLPKAPLTSRSTSALSSAVSTISTITLTENDKHLSDTPEELDEVRTFPHVLLPIVIYLQDHFF